MSSMFLVLLAAFFASFIFIALKAFQQLNVVHNNYLLILPTSFAMAISEVYIIFQIAENGFGWIIVPIGLGGGIGCMLSMYLHGRMRGSS